MSPDRLLQHFERISEAPDAIPRLRRFILDLAVRGKLVEQDPNDEPAAELLKRILVNKGARNLKEKAKSRKITFENEQSENRPSLPTGWAWAQLTDLTAVLNGRAYSKNELLDAGMPVLRVGNLFTSEHWYYSNLTLEEEKYCDKGDLLFAWSASFGPFIWPGPKVIYHYHIWKLSLHSEEDLDKYYLYRFLQHKTQEIKDAGHGISMLHMTKEKMEKVLVPFPPLQEQHRIVAKVDELMALCDQLEAAKTGREQSRDRLVAASLQRLNQPADDEADFHEHAHFTFNHLPRLTTRPEHIKQLRQTILNLAVRGKLVPQDPNDEPATELLRLVQKENRRLQELKQIRAQKPAQPNESFDADTKIPAAWTHAYLQDVAYQITDGTHLTPKYTDEGRPFLSAQNIKPFRFMPQKHRLVSPEDFNNYRANRKPERGDVLLTRVGAGIGEAAVLDSDLEFAFYVSLCLIKIPTQLIRPEYLVLWLNSPEGRESSTVRTYGKGASQGNLNLSQIRTFKLPLPPLTEQRRIVAKVDGLMALCDQLEAQLTATEADSRRLLEAVLHEAIAPAMEAAA